ncbi:hypothetical protein [Stieleria varia]|uniref:Uncharacterized protein n=1 Tax=Stieleria varia TaxID=2528005 RepID=A0A5C5ZUW3_9BACT|nr:hypothetical protein [Stieleria varia]TWT91312.1 hypothetical protein Pla52n_66460 [Stieleria varia]
MAVRLNVVMVQSPPPLPGASVIAETLVGELIGRPGIDLILVERLDRITESSTDHLTLHSLQGDVAVLDWSSAAEQQTALAQIGIPLRVAPHSLASDSPEPDSNRSVPATVNGSRRLYGFDLSTVQNADRVIKALLELQQTRSVKTFSLGNIPVIQKTAPQKTSDATANTSPASSKISAATTQSPHSPSNRKSNANHPTSTSRPSNDDESLDRLLDELDELDV